MKRYIQYMAVVGIVFFSCLCLSQAADMQAQGKTRILLLPFTLNAPSDMAYMQKGVEDMLVSRLTSDQVQVITAKDLSSEGKRIDNIASETDALSLARENDAKYVILGSLTILGDHPSTDAKCINTSTGDAPVIFGQAGDRIDDVMAHINEFADRINRNVFNRIEPRQGARSDQNREAPDSTSDYRQNPENLMAEARSAGSFNDRRDGERSETSDMRMSVWRSPGYDPTITGIDVGDVDGDGQVELVAIAETQVKIYRWEMQRLFQTGTVAEKSRIDYFHVHVADINANGIAEIFLSQWSNNKEPFTTVFEWDGQKYSQTAKIESWFFSTIDIPGQSITLLIGQKADYKGLTGKIYQFDAMNGEYEPQSTLKLPTKLTVHGVAYLSLPNSDSNGIVAYSSGEDLVFYESFDAALWTSDEPYGGSKVAFDRTVPGRPDEIIGRTYLNPKIRTADLNNDGIEEVIAIQNKSSTGTVFERIRTFKTGNIQILRSGVVGLKKIWQSDNVSGYISDMTVGDLNGDGRKEIITAVVPKKSLLEKRARGYLLIWQAMEN